MYIDKCKLYSNTIHIRLPLVWYISIHLDTTTLYFAGCACWGHYVTDKMSATQRYTVIWIFFFFIWHSFYVVACGFWQTVTPGVSTRTLLSLLLSLPLLLILLLILFFPLFLLFLPLLLQSKTSAVIALTTLSSNVSVTTRDGLLNDIFLTLCASTSSVMSGISWKHAIENGLDKTNRSQFSCHIVELIPIAWGACHSRIYLCLVSCQFDNMTLLINGTQKGSA